MENIILDNDSAEYEGDVSPALEYETSLEPIMHDFRFTFSGQDKELSCLQDKNFIGRCKTIYKRLIEHLSKLDYFYQGKYTSGFETMNKAGEQCYAHIHLRFRSQKNTQSMRRTIKRYLSETYDEDTHGNKAMMFKGVVERDLDKFWRYPLKQSLRAELCGGFTLEQLQHMHQVAKDSYQTVVQVNQQKMDRKDNNDTIFQRVISKIIKKYPDNNFSQKEVASEFINTYVEEDRPINRSVIEGYVTNAMIKVGKKSVEDVLRDWGY